MPLCLRPDELDVGMRLASPVTAGRRVLLPPGKVLNGADIDSLRQGYPRVMVYIADPVLDDLVTFQDVTRDRRVARSAQRKLLKAMPAVREKFSSRLSLGGMDLRSIHEAVAQIVHYLHEHPVATAMILPDGSEDCYLTKHSCNVFYLSLVIGNAVRNHTAKAHARRSTLRSVGRPTSPMSLAPLGLAALFMDVALWALEERFEHPGPLSKAERQIVVAHPLAGAEALPPNSHPATVKAVTFHHENEDGGGYPNGLAGPDIPLFAKILRVADAFDAATSERVFREAKSAPRALWEMTMGMHAKCYDPVLLKVFSRVLQPYPIGAKLRLACGRYAVVVRFGKEYALLPEIIIAFDDNGEPLPKRLLEGPYKLDERTDLRIVSFAGEDLTDVYGDEPVYVDPDPFGPQAFETLFEGIYP